MTERFATEDGITDASGNVIPWPTVFDEFGSDKGNHGYAPFYTALEPPTRMLEIGVQFGYSLLAWRKLWPHCEIHGLDINLEQIDPRVRALSHATLFGGMDAATKLYKEPVYDLIVDDASHIPAEQVAAYEVHRHELRPGGIYVIEDVADASIADELGGRLIRTGPGYDDCLLVLP